MVSLAYLNYKNTIKEIAFKNPKLLYFICFKGKPEKFPLKRPLIDIQEDCKELSRFNIFNYKAPYERPTHISDPFCSFTRYGKRIFEEMYQSRVCRELLKFFSKQKIYENGKKIKKNLRITKQEFEQKFWETFTFEEEQNEVLKNSYKVIRETYSYLDFPEAGYSYTKKGQKYHFSYYIKHNQFFFSINIKCSCSNKLVKDIPETDIHEWKNYILNCEICGRQFQISNDFRQFTSIN